MFVVADHASAGREHGLAHEVDVVRGHEAHKLQHVCGGRRQRSSLLQTQHVGDDVADAPVRLVEIRVRDHDAAPLASRAQHESAGGIVLGQPLHRREDQRVMGEHKLAAEARGLVQRRIVDLQRDEDAGDLSARRTRPATPHGPKTRPARRAQADRSSPGCRGPASCSDSTAPHRAWRRHPGSPARRTRAHRRILDAPEEPGRTGRAQRARPPGHRTTRRTIAMQGAFSSPARCRRRRSGRSARSIPRDRIVNHADACTLQRCQRSHLSATCRRGEG